MKESIVFFMFMHIL